MDESSADKIAKEYRGEMWKYQKLATLVGRYLNGEMLQFFHGAKWPVIHLVQTRAKSPTSIRRNLVSGRYDNKLLAPNTSTFSMAKAAIQDLAGVRLIFHFRDNVEEFARSRTALRRWFGEESYEKFQDARIPIKDERGRVREVFGYSSYHFPIIVTPKTDFWHALADEDQQQLLRLECEVQLRTVLQHAWAEAEHDVRYKGISFSVREDRLWGVVSALLEGADHLISERKANAAPGAMSTSEGLTREGAWSYAGNKFPEKKAYCLDGTRFGYEVLHDWNDAALNFVASAELFDVDKAIRLAGGAERFKESMWERLCATDQRFISSFSHDATVARVFGWEGGSQTIHVQPARYSDQMVTNHKVALMQETNGRRVESFGFSFSSIDTDYVGRTCELPVDHWQSEWEAVVGEKDGDFLIRKELLPFEKSPFSNTIGIAAVFLTADDRWVISLRSGGVAYDPLTLGCPASGALAWSEPSRWSGRDVETWVKEGIARECKEELGYLASGAQIKYLAFCREFARAGKPQFFLLIDLSDGPDAISAAQLETCWRMYGDSEHEQLRLLTTSQAKTIAGDDTSAVRTLLVGLGMETAKPNEELRMNLALALKYKELLH